MRRLTVFNHVSLDGYFVDANGSMRWAKVADDSEWNEFVSENAKGGGTLLFGRVTYDLMNSYWPTPMAHEHMPAVAERMNSAPKVVFSRTMENATWNNTTLVKGDIAEQIRKMKKESGEGMVIMGSGSIIAQLAPEGVIDEYQVVVNPIVLGAGRTMFEGVKNLMGLKQKTARVFKNGNVYLCYEPES